MLDSNLLIENIDRAAEYDLINKKVFGSAYLVCGKNVNIQRCYGFASLNNGSPVTSRTLFRLASMTKPVTAIATLIAVERGLLSLDDRVDKFLPKFKDIKIIDKNGEGEPKNIPTIRNILSHSSGIGSNFDKLGTMSSEDKRTLDNAIDFYIKVGLDFEPGSAAAYSPTGAFDALTKIIEMVTDTDYLDFLKKEIFSPCEMPDTTFIPTQEERERMVEMHNRIDGENTTYKMPLGCVFEDIPCTHFLGGAGLVSTLRDYGNFSRMLLNKGLTENGRIIKEETFRMLSTYQVPKEFMRGPTRWGLGVRVISEDTYPYLPVGCYGWSGAYGSHFWIDPKNEIYAVFMKNSRIDGGSGNESARNFEKAVYSSFK